MLNSMKKREQHYDNQEAVHGSVEVLFLPPLLNPAVSQYFQPRAASAEAGAWVETPEVPTTEELLRVSPAAVNGSRDSQSRNIHIVPNTIVGPWKSKEAFLNAHYDFLREEAVRPLREAVAQLKIVPAADEETFRGAVGIYEKVRIIGFVASRRGVAMRITFSTRRAGKKILWKQAKRLLSGTLVALTPSNDMFMKKTVVATVAARPLEGLQLNPPELELFFGRAEELEIDPAREWTMIESRSSFFEAQRYTLLALQKLMHEPFNMSKYLVNVDQKIEPPAYLLHAPMRDLTTAFCEPGYTCINVVELWPQTGKSSLDTSQFAALERMQTKCLAIIQGPPGTGKTHVSVHDLRIKLANWKEGDPPIIVTCQTNHALDQLLRHVAEFEPNFIRLGGRSKDSGVIKGRTLYAVRTSTCRKQIPGCQAPRAGREMLSLEADLAKIVLPLKHDNTPLDHHILYKHNLLSEAQAKSLEDGASRWIQAGLQNPNEMRSPFQVWLTNILIKAPYKPELEDFGFDFEEAELEFEQLKDVEAENAANDDEFADALQGNFYTLADNFACARISTLDDRAVGRLLKKEQDMWKIPEASRGPIYRFLQRRLKLDLVEQFRVKAKQYDQAARRHRIGLWERDENILREQKVIGLTTTGLSKYRGLIASLGCKIVLVEEAAETLEAPIIAACLPTLEQLILVGDHKQLRPHCNVRSHEGQPMNFDVSLFERLINNNLGMTTLVKQRRMIPEVRRLLRPIYGDIVQDHDFVTNPANRPDVPGMGGINSWFFTHSWPERRDEMMSCINVEEAKMIVGFVQHLVHNGVKSEDITVLTFYNGQRKAILRGLRKADTLFELNSHVVTVDSYQGEENKIVILSLVRSNTTGTIGFLSSQNRVCVALSRAQCGFYLFGNAQLLVRDPTWRAVVLILSSQDKQHPDEIPAIDPFRMNYTLPLCCTKHSNKTDVGDPSDWDGLFGGCRLPCAEQLACGHKCLLSCHPFDHGMVPCTVPCSKMLKCGHKCSQQCLTACICNTCSKSGQQSHEGVHEASDGQNARSRISSAREWQEHATAEVARYADVSRIAPLRTQSPPKESLLIDLGTDSPPSAEVAKEDSTAMTDVSLAGISLLD